ncbi:MAG: 5-dehydro-2-deoxygluconokinase [Propionibacteriaceae bacterium]|jgi:5-dehydro-2-deoxygluconokinase|nr:5-dehydro-2-deoxygluconokinase [Propionibacteriaceae bacterium]
MAGGGLDLVALGRISVDIYPLDIGVDLEDVRTFGKYVGGSATNVAIATARYGHTAALVTKTGDDAFGRYLKRDLAAEFGVRTDFVTTDACGHTPVTFCAIKPPEDFPLYFYRTPAPDMQVTVAEVQSPELAEAIATARIFWVTGTGLAQEPIRSAQWAALEDRAAWGAGAAGAGRAVPQPRYTVFDLDYRRDFWPDPVAAHSAIASVLGFADVVVGNQTECAVAVGGGSPDEQADRLLAAGAGIAIVKMGSAGVLGKTAAERVVVPPVVVDTVNGLGAGDAFGGALNHGLLAGWPLGRTLAFANAAGAYVARQIACSSAMPTEAEVLELMGE